MATQKPISTISYNSEKFLKEKLNSWYNAHIIQAYQYIVHKGEDGDKDHIHLRIEPNKRVDPMSLSEDLKEYEAGKEKPRGCRPWRPSKEEDWILYAVHDKKYLKFKYGGGEKGEKLPYKWKDIKVSDDYDIEIAFIRARASLEHTSGNIASRMKKGDLPLSLILEGENVYTVNAIMHALQKNDYIRLQEDFLKIKSKYDLLFDFTNDLLEKEKKQLIEDEEGILKVKDIE